MKLDKQGEDGESKKQIFVFFCTFPRPCRHLKGDFLTKHTWVKRAPTCTHRNAGDDFPKDGQLFKKDGEEIEKDGRLFQKDGGHFQKDGRLFWSACHRVDKAWSLVDAIDAQTSINFPKV